MDMEAKIAKHEEALKKLKMRARVERRRVMVSERKRRAHLLIAISTELCTGLNTLPELENILAVLKSNDDKVQKFKASVKTWLEYYSKNMPVAKPAIAKVSPQIVQDDGAGFGQIVG